MTCAKINISLDQLAAPVGGITLPMAATEFEVRHNPGIFEPDETLRASMTEEILTTYFSHPAVGSVFAWNFLHEGDPEALGTIFAARPDVLNHNIETVPRLQRAARPSASYARSLAVLARAKAAGLTTKSSIIVGIGEEPGEVLATLADLRGVGVDIVTIGQYLRPTTNHLPVARWVEPDEFLAWKVAGEAMGIGHVEAGPLTRSSYHARQSADAAAPVAVRSGHG